MLGVRNFPSLLLPVGDAMGTFSILMGGLGMNFESVLNPKHPS